MRKLVFTSLFLLACGNGFRHAEIRVSGNCDMCRETIENALKIPAVKRANWDSETGILEVDYDENTIRLNEIRKLLADAGYDSDSMKASLKAYSKLHECCRYRENMQ